MDLFHYHYSLRHVNFYKESLNPYKKGLKDPSKKGW